ncbi:MAG: 4-(cytidine 5'-diphospho)-2-C-methyl-D-erythritol kinase [Ilumatobacteraceae bacterium]|nr:4-(cytidine 5'-diphospho)-2-C-methyl-D-erythritol kinase [Ilumatobacteraceae bacterium]
MNTASNTSILIDAPAKLTLSLRVTGVREDGFHLIDAEMVTLNLVDKVRITPNEDGLSVDGPFGDGVATDSSNLVNRALALAGRRARVHIEKNIPSGGGLGGGSADAAAVLKWAGFTDLEAASRLGADIPFCMIGGRARVQGIGEVIDILPPVQRKITLVIPPFGVSTPAVYRAWDDLAKAGMNTTNDQNHLQQAALIVEPRLIEWHDKIAQACGQAPVLAGSGSTWWLDGAFLELAKDLPKATVVVTQTR